MSRPPTKVAFFYPSRTLGGAELLFGRLAREIQGRGLGRSILIDFEDGSLQEQTEADKVDLYPFRPGSINTVPGVDVLVTPASFVYFVGHSLRLPPEARILFWSIHPRNLESVLPLFRRCRTRPEALRRCCYSLGTLGEFQRLRKNIRGLVAKSSLVFMDESNRAAVTKLFKLVLPPSYLPIPIPLQEASPGPISPGRMRGETDRPMTLAWLGRVDDQKANSVRALYRELSRYAQLSGRNLRLLVIGGGDRLPEVKSYCIGRRNLRVEFTGQVPERELTSLFREQIDVLVAMGTSALEGASRGCPTLLVDVFLGFEPKKCTFSWLHETSAYSLGFIHYRERDLPAGGLSLEKAMEDLDGDYHSIARKSLDYAVVHHGLPAVLRSLMDQATGSNLTFEGLLQTIRCAPPRRMYRRLRGKP